MTCFLGQNELGGITGYAKDSFLQTGDNDGSVMWNLSLTQDLLELARIVNFRVINKNLIKDSSEHIKKSIIDEIKNLFNPLPSPQQLEGLYNDIKKLYPNITYLFEQTKKKDWLAFIVKKILTEKNLHMRQVQKHSLSTS